MDHLVEFVLELLFGGAKETPDQRPEMEYVDRFVVRYPRRKTAAVLCVGLICTSVFSFLCFFVQGDVRYLYAAFAGLGAIVCALYWYELTFRCEFDGQKIARRSLVLFQKEIKWSDVLCVRLVERTNEKSRIIALYNQAGKCVIDFGTDMENAWYIVKMAEQKEIEIKNEKDLTLKQLAHL